MSDLYASGLADHQRLSAQMADQLKLIRSISDAIVAAFERGAAVYLAGNGGSAADAQHIAAEFVGRFKRERRALPAVAFSCDTSNLTSIGNDYGFDRVFSRQVEALVRPGDVFWALSTSGNSPNVLRAAELARQRGATVIGFTGRTGGELKPLCHHCLCIDHMVSDRIQEMHQLAYHLICDAVEQHFAEAKRQ